MKIRTVVMAVTTISVVGLFSGLGVLFFGSSELIARLPANGILVAAVVTLIGTVYLSTSKSRPNSKEKSQSVIYKIGFAFLVVIALILLFILLMVLGFFK